MTAINLAERTVVHHLDLDTQRRLVVDATRVVSQTGLIAPTAGGREMSVRIANAGALGWVADANGYRYAPTSPKTGKPWPPIPDEWRDLADRFAGAHPWDCAHLVYYGPSATLGWHRDKTEKSKRWPIVTFSLGDEASWAVREDDGEPIHRTRLPSGAVTLLAGEARNYLHTIERIEPAMALLSPSPLKGPGRLAISLRVAG